VTLGGIEDLYGPGSVDYYGADAWSCAAARAAAAAAPAASAEPAGDEAALWPDEGLGFAPVPGANAP
jgi:hypothetical protein